MPPRRVFCGLLKPPLFSRLRTSLPVGFRFLNLPSFDSQVSHSLDTSRMMFGRFRAQCCRRSSTVRSPSRDAVRMAFLVVERHTPALAASSATVRAQAPVRFTSSDTTRRTASSPCVIPPRLRPDPLGRSSKRKLEAPDYDGLQMGQRERAAV